LGFVDEWRGQAFNSWAGRRTIGEKHRTFVVAHHHFVVVSCAMSFCRFLITSNSTCKLAERGERNFLMLSVKMGGEFLDWVDGNSAVPILVAFTLLEISYDRIYWLPFFRDNDDNQYKY